MSIPILPRTPAHSGFRPTEPEYAPAADGLARAVCALMGMAGKVEKKLPASQAPDGYYLFSSDDGRRFFLKVVPNDYRERQSRAEAIAHALKAAGVPVNACLDGFPRACGGGHAAFAYPYVAARFGGTDEADMRAFGASVAAMHAAMARLPHQEEILVQARRRLEYVRDAHARLLTGALTAPFPAARRAALLEPDFTGLLFDAGGQPIHGDLNCGNALFPLDGSAPIILDFEDAMLSFGTPWVDVALILERFVLIPLTDDAAALDAGRAFIEAWLEYGTPPAAQRGPPLRDVLAGTAQRSLCLLADLAALGRSVAATEWEKFVFLRQQADVRADVLAELDLMARANVRSN